MTTQPLLETSPATGLPASIHGTADDGLLVEISHPGHGLASDVPLRPLAISEDITPSSLESLFRVSAESSANLTAGSGAWVSGLDFNQDNRPDILWRNLNTGANTVWLLGGPNGNQVGEMVSLTDVPSVWGVRGIADFNGDGRPDLLWRNSSNGNNVVWLMGGASNNQIIGTLGLTNTPQPWDMKGIADFNGDGRPDLLWRNSSNGNNVVWLMGGANNNQIIGTLGLTNTPQPWDMKGIADFNGDGRPDLLWRNSSNGNNVVWLMGGANNNQIIGTLGLTNMGSQWDPLASAWLPPYLRVLSPNGGNNLVAGNTYTITWADNIRENVRIDLYRGGQFHSAITPSTASNGSYSWVVPNTLEPNSNYSIRVASVNHPSLFDASDSSFSLTRPSTFTIQFDYRFDTNGWFTAPRRAALEAAGRIWESIILDEFTNIPVGTALNVRNPQTGEMTTLTSDYVIDDLVVFVGARPLSNLGIGGPSGTWFVGSALETRYRGSDFEPWTGSMTFNSNATWFFDDVPLITDVIPSGQNDFVSVAVHELGHVLGIGTSDAYRNLVTLSNGSYYFTGTNATLQNGGTLLPLHLDDSHILEGHDQVGDPGEAAMDPTLTVGTRKLVTRLDAAILDDIGYIIDYNRTYRNP